MKNFLPALLPALALLTLGGCVGTSGIASTESDGVYYSSKDKTIYTASAAPASSYDEGYAATTDEAANPDYNESASSTARTGSDEYYDENYGYSTARVRRSANQPYRGMGLGYYDLAYVDPFFGGGYGAFSPYGAFYDPFFSPYGFGSPFAFGGGSFINIGLGFGNPWARPWRGGYGGFGGFGGGYGRGFYDGFYNGYYGGLGGLGYGGLGYGVPIYGNSYSRAYTENRRAVNVAPRRDRSSQAYNLDRASNGNNPVMSTRSRSGNVMNGSSAPTSTPAPVTTAGRGRGRILNAPAASPQPTVNPSQPEVREAARSSSRRWRTVDPATAAPATAPTYSQPQQEARQARRVMRSEPSQETSRSQRTYSQPSRSESYSQPSRSESYSSPSMSSPSNSGGSSGGSRGRVR